MSEIFRIGLVAIGRNEGERLRRCLDSVVGKVSCVVYVDSGSTDDSVAMARNLGVEVVELDMTIPFTAARARNEGFDRIKQLRPDLSYVQFVDGDCEIVSGWLECAAAFLDQHKDIAVVCGRRRERFPDDSIYNKLCDLEWDTPVGQARSCGGDAMMRTSAFEAVGKYRSSLIAGEEPELCVRLRAASWKIWRLDNEMTLHDAAMKNIFQWWKRTTRAGYAYAEGASLHGGTPERHCVAALKRILLWGIIVPLGWLIGYIYLGWVALVGLLATYIFQIVRLAIIGGPRSKISWIRAFFLVIGKFAETEGFLKYYFRQTGNVPAKIIEYK